MVVVAVVVVVVFSEAVTVSSVSVHNELLTLLMGDHASTNASSASSNSNNS